MLFRVFVVFMAALPTAIASVFYPYLGLLVLVVFHFARPQDDRPNIIALHLPLVFILATSLGMMFRISESLPRVTASLKRLWIVLILFAFMAVSAAIHWTELSKRRLDDHTTLICLCVMTLAMVVNEKRLNGYILTLLGCGTYVVYKVIQNPSHIYERIGDQDFHRLSMMKGGSMFGNSNYLALLMVWIIFLSMTMMSYYKSLWQRLILLCLSAGAVYVFFRANSRGASIALAVGLVVLWITQRHKVRTFVLAVVFIAAATLMAPDAYWARMKTVATYQQDASATGRLELWDIALDLIKQHPVLGVGPDNFVLYATNTPHDAYLQIASELGIPALMVFIVMLISGLRAAWKARQLSKPESGGNACIWAVSNGILCCQVAVIVQGFTTGLAHREVVYVSITVAYCAQILAEKVLVAKKQTEPAAVKPVPLKADFRPALERPSLPT